MRQPGDVQRVLVAIAAWTCVGALLIGIARLAIPFFASFLDGPSTLGTVLVKSMTLFLLLVCFAGWVAVLWHAAVHAPFRSPVQRVVIIGLLVFFNIVAYSSTISSICYGYLGREMCERLSNTRLKLSAPVLNKSSCNRGFGGDSLPFVNTPVWRRSLSAVR